MPSVKEMRENLRYLMVYQLRKPANKSHGWHNAPATRLHRTVPVKAGLIPVKRIYQDKILIRQRTIPHAMASTMTKSYRELNRLDDVVFSRKRLKALTFQYLKDCYREVGYDFII